MGDLDQPVLRKKRQAAKKNKDKNFTYSQKHIRHMEQLVNKKTFLFTNNINDK